MYQEVIQTLPVLNKIFQSMAFMKIAIMLTKCLVTHLEIKCLVIHLEVLFQAMIKKVPALLQIALLTGVLKVYTLYVFGLIY